MCDPKGYGFLAVLVINRVSILAICLSFDKKSGMDFCTLVLNSFFLLKKLLLSSFGQVINRVGKIAYCGHK